MCQKIEKYLPVRSGTCCPIVWADRATDGTPKMEPPKIVFQNESKIDNNILSPMSCVHLIIYSHCICPNSFVNLIVYSHVMCQKIEKYLPVRSGTCCPIVWADRATDGTPKMEPPKIVFQNESKIDNNILSPMSCVNLIIYSHVICPKKWKNTCPLDRRITSTSCVKK